MSKGGGGIGRRTPLKNRAIERGAKVFETDGKPVKVVVTDIDIGFVKLVLLVVQVALAMIPGLVIAAFVVWYFVEVVSKMVG